MNDNPIDNIKRALQVNFEVLTAFFAPNIINNQQLLNEIFNNINAWKKKPDNYPEDYISDGFLLLNVYVPRATNHKIYQFEIDKYDWINDKEIAQLRFQELDSSENSKAINFLHAIVKNAKINKPPNTEVFVFTSSTSIADIKYKAFVGYCVRKP